MSFIHKCVLYELEDGRNLKDRARRCTEILQASNRFRDFRTPSSITDAPYGSLESRTNSGMNRTRLRTSERISAKHTRTVSRESQDIRFGIVKYLKKKDRQKAHLLGKSSPAPCSFSDSPPKPPHGRSFISRETVPKKRCSFEGFSVSQPLLPFPCAAFQLHLGRGVPRR